MRPIPYHPSNYLLHRYKVILQKQFVLHHAFYSQKHRQIEIFAKAIYLHIQYLSFQKLLIPSANALANFPAVEEVPVVLFINFPLCCGSPLTKYTGR